MEEATALHQPFNFSFIQQFKRKFHFDEWSEIKMYYNSMLKVISWYKLNHKWKTTWIWWKLAGMKWYEFMNGMTFNAAGHQQHFLFFLNCSLRMGNSKKRSLLRPCCPREWMSLIWFGLFDFFVDYFYHFVVSTWSIHSPICDYDWISIKKEAFLVTV